MVKYHFMLRNVITGDQPVPAVLAPPLSFLEPCPAVQTAIRLTNTPENSCQLRQAKTV